MKHGIKMASSKQHNVGGKYGVSYPRRLRNSGIGIGSM